MPIQVDTFGWDTVYAIRFNKANDAISAKWAQVSNDAKTINYSNFRHTLIGELGPWSLTPGGDGHIVLMDIPFVSGEISGEVANHELAGAVATVEIDLAFVSGTWSSSQFLKVNSSSNTTNTRNFKLDSLPFDQNVVTKVVFNAWLVKNIVAFDHIFHTIDYSPELYVSGKMSFLKPTNVSYAVTDMGSLENSVFGILAMTENHAVPRARLVSQYAVPTDCDSGFNISGPIFTEEVLAISAALQFELPEEVKSGSDDQKNAFVRDWAFKNFLFSDSGMQVMNKNSMKFGTFLDDNNNKREMTVPAGGFRLSVDFGLITVSFTGLTYEYSKGIYVHLNYEERFELEIIRDPHLPADHKYKYLDLKSVMRKLTCIAKKSAGILATEIVVGLVTTVAFAVLGGLAGEAVDGLISNATKTTTTAVQGSTAVMEMTELMAQDTAGNTIRLTTAQAEMAAAEVSRTTIGTVKGMFGRIAPKLVGGFVGSMISGNIMASPEYMRLTAYGLFNELPTFTTFSENLLSTHKWPEGDNTEVKSVKLRTSFQLGLNFV